MLGSSLKSLGTEGATLESGFGQPAAIGELMLEKFLIAFEVSSMLLLLAAVGAIVLAGPQSRRGARAVAAEWYLVLSALLFAIGAGGVLIRRSLVVILLCLELMLNAGNLALVTFSRMLGDQDGQIFASIVMVVAACEVVIGLGLIVALYRRRLPLNVDELRGLRGMSATAYAWLVLAFPLAGAVVIGLSFRLVSGRVAGIIGTTAIGLAFLSGIGALVDAARQARRGAAT